MVFSFRQYCLFFLVLFLSVAPTLAAGPLENSPAKPDSVNLSVQFGESTISRPVMAVSVLPKEDVLLTITSPPGSLRVASVKGTLTPVSENSWRYFAPSSPGLSPISVTHVTSGSTILLQVFVLQPWNHAETSLDGYRVGHYKQRPRRGLEVYEPPEGFVKVTEKNRTVAVSPNFRLDQFLCKQSDELPQFALVRTRLLQKLERILAALNERGHQVSTLYVMSGFRTPYYNRAIGNTTEYSRHLYGDAADIFVDTNDDGRMDDLNGDGRVSTADARHLAGVVRAVAANGEDQFEGGLGIYGPAPHRGPFVHIDSRGYRARW